MTDATRISTLIKQIDEDYDNPVPIHELFLLLVKNKDIEQALQLVEKYQSTHNNDDIKYDFAVGLYLNGYYEKSRQVLKKLVQTDDVIYMIASSFNAENDFAQSLAYLMLLKNCNVDSKLLMGINYFSIGEFSLAEEKFAEVLQENTRNYKANFYLGLLDLINAKGQSDFLDNAKTIDRDKFMSDMERFSSISKLLGQNKHAK